MNQMCQSCARLNTSCNGTTQAVWTGCVYYRKEYWGVVSTFDSAGELEVLVGSVFSSQRPANLFEELEDFHSYTNWFDTEQEAETFVVGLRAERI